MAAHSFKVTQAAQMLGDIEEQAEMKLIGVLYMKKLLIMTIQSDLLVTSKHR